MNRVRLQWVLAVVAAVALVTACTAPTPVSEIVEITRIVEGETVVVTAEPGPQQEPVTLKVWDQFGGDVGNLALELIYSNFMRKYPYITIEREVVGTADADQTARTALASGTGPDVVYLDITPTRVLIDAGLILALDDYASQYGWEELFTDQGLKWTTYEGKLWGLGGEAEFVGTWYNKTLFEKEGWEVPTTLSEVLEWCPQAVERGYEVPIANWIEGYGTVFGWMTNPLHNYVGVDYIEGLLFRHEGRWDSPDMIRAIEIVHKDMREAGCWGEEPLGWTAANDLFFQQKAPMMHNGTWMLPDMVNFEAENDVEVGMLPFFDLENGHPPVFTQGMGSAWFISAATEHPNEAGLFLNYFFSDPEAVRIFVEQGHYFPPLKMDMTEFNMSPLARWVAETLAAGGMGWDIDVLAPEQWNVANFDGGPAIWLGQKTVEEHMADLQRIWEEEYWGR